MGTTANITAAEKISKKEPILLVHNHYRKPGGEDSVFSSEGTILERYGHNVIRFEEFNSQISGLNPVSLGITTVWGRTACEKLADVVRLHRPQIVHFHNTFPLISPAAYRTARSRGAAVVQTLHNFRLFCINGLF